METAELDPTENNINNMKHSHIKRLGKDGEGHKQVGATEHKRDSMAERVKMVKKWIRWYEMPSVNAQTMNTSFEVWKHASIFSYFFIDSFTKNALERRKLRSEWQQTGILDLTVRSDRVADILMMPQENAEP